jgi:hypothetical protein
MHPLTYLHLQMQLRGASLVGDRLTREANATAVEDLPLIILAQLTTHETVAYYNESLPADLQKKLATGIEGLAFPHIDPLLEILSSHDLHVEAEHSTTYIFPHIADSIDREILRYSTGDPRMRALELSASSGPVFAVERDSRLASACVSGRENEQCGEAWVYMDPGTLEQGLTEKVVSAWARSLMDARKIPFYSHEAGDELCTGLATRLGLEPVFEEISITQVSA